MEIEYSEDLYYAGRKTIYVSVNDERIGWISARQDFDPFKIHFCYSYNSRKSKKMGVLRSVNTPTYIFNNQDELENWIRNNHSPK